MIIAILVSFCQLSKENIIAGIRNILIIEIFKVNTVEQISSYILFVRFYLFMLETNICLLFQVLYSFCNSFKQIVTI